MSVVQRSLGPGHRAAGSKWPSGSKRMGARLPPQLSGHDRGGKTSVLLPAPHPSQLLLPFLPALEDRNARTHTHSHLRTPAPRPAGGALEVKGDWRRGGQFAGVGAGDASPRRHGPQNRPLPRNSPRHLGPTSPGTPHRDRCRLNARAARFCRWCRTSSSASQDRRRCTADRDTSRRA